MSLPSSIGGLTTETVGLFRVGCEPLAAWLASEVDATMSPLELEHPTLEAVIRLLAPSPSTRGLRVLLPWAGWTLLLTGGPLGTDPGLLPSRAARDLKVMAIRATASPAPAPNEGTILEVFEPEVRDNGCLRRSIEMILEGSLHFSQFGEPFPFESTEAYSQQGVRNRFSPVLLEEYLVELGVPRDIDLLNVRAGVLLARRT